MKPTKLPSGSWRIQVYLGKDKDGKKIYQSVTRLDKNDCIIEASQIARHHHETERDPKSMTLGEAIDKYISLKDGILSPSTIRNYKSMRENHFQTIIETPLSKISKNVAQMAINEESKQYSPKTVKNAYRLLTAVMNQFASGLPSITLKETEEREVNTMNQDEIRTLVTALRGDKSEVPLLLALFLGLRRSEIMALEHTDYDQETKKLSISKAKVPNKDGEYVVKTTKTRKGRRKISVPPYLAAKLESCIERGEPFYNVAPERPYKRLQQLCEKYNLPKMSMHDLRHQNASIMLALGIPDKYAMERGGWSSNTVMKNIYQHTMDEERAAADEKMEGFFKNIIA